MKKLLFITLLVNPFIVVKGQLPEKTCQAVKELVTLAAADKLNGLAGDPFESQYMKPLFSTKLNKSVTNIPAAKESFVSLDQNTGGKYNAYLNDYGTDAIAAHTDFTKIVAAYSACLPDGQLTKPNDETAFILLRGCKIKLRVYECSWTKTWTTYVTVEHQ